jgi:NitT/TauT family transport system ATP-binding protein
VTTPGEIASLTEAGKAVVTLDAAGRKAATRERIREHPLFVRVLGMLREGEGTLDDDDVLADLTICFPFAKAQAMFRTVVEWGRYAELLDHESRSHRLVLREPRGT